MKYYTFKQLGTYNKIKLKAETVNEAKAVARKHFNCRESSCLHIHEDGIVNAFVGTNEKKNQKLIIKADDTICAKYELAYATNSEFEDWDITASYPIDDLAINDIQYETLS